jgi:hypothetical protein
MIKEQDILNTLDHSKDEPYGTFICLGEPYSYLIDSRLNIFRDENDHWAIAAERLGYNPRAGFIMLEVSYYGNCLTNLEESNNRKTNNYYVYPIDRESFAMASEGETIKADADSILVRGQQLKLSHSLSDYEAAGITLKQYEPNEIRWEEAGRLLVSQHRNLFRATDEELYKSIPKSMQKVLVIDEWYHKDFELLVNPIISDEHLRQAYDFNKNTIGTEEMDYESFKTSYKHSELQNNEWNQTQWNENRPGAYETFQLVAKVITTGDTSLYRPTLLPNSHWKNWEESGSL